MSGYALSADEIGPYATVAEFETPEDLIEAADAARLAGFKKMDAYTPFPIHGLSDAIGFKSNAVPFLVFWGGLTGALVGYGLQYYVHVLDYPMNVGGKPLNSIPSMIPITYECTILFAGLTAFFSMIALNRLPKLYHSIFNTPNFDRASNDRFFLAIEAADPNYESGKVHDFLAQRGALSVVEVAK
ncbi:DUF3341 domain-containing protein [bacterium]|nr:MAG: DUF3341 domain-containing protein [bacterium]